MARGAGRYGLKGSHAAIAAALLVLLGGRWLAVRSTNLLWAESVGAASVHAGIAELRLMLLTIAFSAAAVWCLGNLYAVYRSIGALHVPRRLGNLEFVEALPPRSLLVIVFVLGLALSLLLTSGASDWWRLNALSGIATRLDVSDPILGHDLSFYLFELPWRRAVHEFVTLGVGLMLAVTIVLYAAVGAVRWSKRTLGVTDLARMHLAVLLGAFALALYWGYRLEPVEYVGGVHDVPLDAVLIDVRIPAARLLSAVALLVALASFAWIWLRPVALVAVPWITLATASFSAHYVVPAVSGGGRTDAMRTLQPVEDAREQFLAAAYGLTVLERSVPLEPDPASAMLAREADRLGVAPFWDAFAVTAFLNTAALEDSSWRFDQAVLASYGTAAGPVPVYLAPVRPNAARTGAPGPDWDAIHRGPFATARRPAAIHGARAQPNGAPLFVRDLERPDSVSASVVSVGVSDSVFHFAPGLTAYAVTDRPDVAGVEAGGLARRLALAWVLQSPRLLTRDAVRGSRIVWDRAVAERLDRYAPFAQFGRPYPAVANGRLYWLANGYVSASVFPLAPAVTWRGSRVRALAAGFVGVVDAASGETRVYVLPGADPLSATWADLASEIVRPWEELSRALRSHVRYPEELFRVQWVLLAGGDVSRSPGPELFWWLGGTPQDTTRRLRVVAGVTEGDPPRLTRIVDGAVVAGRPTLAVARFTGQAAPPRPAEVIAQLTAVRPDEGVEPGQLRWIPLAQGPLAVQTSYRTAPGPAEPTRLVGVAAAWAGGAALGATLPDAVRRLSARSPQPRTEAGGRWAEARRWFERLDAARRLGDWQAFGEAYDALRRLLVGAADTLP